MITRNLFYLPTIAGLPLLFSATLGQEAPPSPYLERPLQLPQLGPDGQCPVSTGSVGVVESGHPYIFGAGGHFFGSGPVYFGLSWKPADRAGAYFELIDQIPKSPDGYRLKTPWIMDPAYEGEALIRGAMIGSKESRNLLFSENSQVSRITEDMILRSAPAATRRARATRYDVAAVWGFWPSSMLLSEPGCYAIQIDTESSSDLVVFNAIEQSRE